MGCSRRTSMLIKLHCLLMVIVIHSLPATADTYLPNNTNGQSFPTLGAAEAALRGADPAYAALQFDHLISETDTEQVRLYTLPTIPATVYYYGLGYSPTGNSLPSEAEAVQDVLGTPGYAPEIYTHTSCTQAYVSSSDDWEVSSHAGPYTNIKNYSTLRPCTNTGGSEFSEQGGFTVYRINTCLSQNYYISGPYYQLNPSLTCVVNIPTLIITVTREDECPVLDIADLEDITPNDPDTLALTQALEAGVSGYDLLSQATRTAEQCLSGKINQLGGINYTGTTSEFRTVAYQKHLYELWGKALAHSKIKDPHKKQICRIRGLR